MFYDKFGYQHSTIGSMADLNAASVHDVAEFFRIYYAPNNAVLTVVGDFKRDPGAGDDPEELRGHSPSAPRHRRSIWSRHYKPLNVART